MKKMPIRIFDIHTHLLNARYIPLASIIANAMGKDESRLANYVAQLLEELTGSSYEEEKQNDYLNELLAITEHELRLSIRSIDALKLDDQPSSEIIATITELSKIDYAEEGWIKELPKDISSDVSTPDLKSLSDVDDVVKWAMRVLKKALWIVTELMDPRAWGKAENYLEFFLTMLRSEEKMVEKLFSSYGDDLPPLQISHYLLDMQMAYEKEKAPYYAFHPTQLVRMEALRISKPDHIFGFSAFDPHRKNWRQYAEDALNKGFVGFKFYPAMGYKPSGNDNQEHQQRIDNFFDFCVQKDVPIFAHCTPNGFQTRHNLGGYAHPKYWRDVLDNERWNELRLCLGHAGGDYAKNGDLESHGWMAKTNVQWDHQDNFARIVAELCTKKTNVFCEFGYLTDLFEPDNKKIFLSNLERAISMSAEFQFLDKLAYGSDWHMPSMVDNTDEYIHIFLDIFDKYYKDHLDNFFWRNAYKYLKLPM